MGDSVYTFLIKSEPRNAEDKILMERFVGYWSELIRQSTPIDLKKGQALFYEGHLPCGIFVIVSGEVLLFQKGRFEQDGALGKLTYFQPIGIDLLANGHLYPYTAMASQDAKAYFISKSDLAEGCSSDK